MHNTHKSLFAVHSAVLIFGLTALFSKLITLTAIEISMLRSIIAACFIAAILVWQKKSLRLSKLKDYAIVFVIGLLLALHWVTYFHAMQVSTIAVGVISLYTFPIITVFLEPFFHGQKLHLKDIAIAFIALFGVYLLVPEFSINNQTTQGFLWGILSALLFALRNILQGRYFTHCSARHSLFYQTLVTFLILLPFSYSVIPSVNINQWQQLLVLGLVFTALPHTLFAFSLLTLKAKTVGLVACVQVVYATSFAALFLNEIPELSTIFGGLIIITAAMYESYSAKK